MQDTKKINWAIIDKQYDRVVRGPISDDLYAANDKQRESLSSGCVYRSTMHVANAWEVAATRPPVQQPGTRIPGHYTVGYDVSIPDKRYLDPATGFLYDDAGDEVNSGFKEHWDGTWVCPCAVFTPDALLVPAPAPVERYAVQSGNGTGSGAGNSLRLYYDVSKARSDAQAKASDYPGTEVKLLKLTELDTFKVTIQTLKSWEK